MIPGRMTTWTPGNNGEHMPKHKHHLKLQFTNFSGPVQMNYSTSEEQKRQHDSQNASLLRQKTIKAQQMHQQQSAASQQDEEKWKLKETPKNHQPGLRNWVEYIEEGLITRFDSYPY